MKKILQKIFSVKNSETRKIITILFFKVKIPSKYLAAKTELKNKICELEWYKQEKYFMQGEINSLLNNYRNFTPITNKTKIYLLNDTSRDINHLGTYLVQENL